MNEWRSDDIGKLVLRVSLGVLMLFHGVSKLLNPGAIGFIGSKLEAVGLPSAIAYGVYLGEVVAPLLVVLGLFSRIGGMLIAGTMVFAIGLVHMGEVFSLSDSGGWRLELQGFYLFGGIALMFLGSGRYAVRPD